MVKRIWDSSGTEPHAFQHRHAFTGNEPEAERAQWLQDRLEYARRAGIRFAWRKTADGYEMGFDDFASFARFRLEAYGDDVSRRGHRCTQQFPDGLDAEWVHAAQMFLQAAGIGHELEVKCNQVSFVFDRFSESAALRLMIDAGEIDRAARVLRDTKLFLGRPPGLSAGSDPTPLL